MAGFLQQIGGQMGAYDLMRFALFSSVLYNLYFHPLRNIPGPPLWIAFPIARTLSMVKGTAEFQVRDAHAKYGEVVRLGPRSVSFITPQAWKDIYGHGHAEFPKFYPKGIHMDPKKIISSNAPDHFRFRRAMLPAFSDKALTQQEPLIRVYVDLLIERLREVAKTGRSTDMVRWYNFTTFDLIGDLAFGTSLNGLEQGKSNAWLDNIWKLMRFMPVLVLMGVSPILGLIIKLTAGSKMRDSQANHIALVDQLVQSRLYHRKQADRGDFMDYFLRSRGQAHGLTDTELTANSDLLMIAGSETTATLLSGVMYWMLKSPHALRRATEEVRDAFGSDEVITLNEARAKLPYMIACLEEALRLFPPVPLALSRSVPDGPPVQIAGYTIPPKTTVGVHHLSAYYSEINFHRAREFVPERWLPESVTNPASPFYHDRRDIHRPFSFGPRDCIGRNLAYHEVRLIMARVLWNFDLTLDAKSDGWHGQRIFSLWEKQPLEVVITPRKA
ncbi:cytochrome P450 [Durotheca rogersii]|uniref:cytochrome P450 n=1 Tax=Durotheca rogersii TaxID=419775 RepID=UPI00221FF172|nr:cytochrome P450 [Durotheca rogersii]KAI5867891.1 cytochrome P450 [Durotheca rogersii]